MAAKYDLTKKLNIGSMDCMTWLADSDLPQVLVWDLMVVVVHARARPTLYDNDTAYRMCIRYYEHDLEHLLPQLFDQDSLMLVFSVYGDMEEQLFTCLYIDNLDNWITLKNQAVQRILQDPEAHTAEKLSTLAPPLRAMVQLRLAAIEYRENYPYFISPYPADMCQYFTMKQYLEQVDYW